MTNYTIAGYLGGEPPDEMTIDAENIEAVNQKLISVIKDHFGEDATIHQRREVFVVYCDDELSGTFIVIPSDENQTDPPISGNAPNQSDAPEINEPPNQTNIPAQN